MRSWLDFISMYLFSLSLLFLGEEMGLYFSPINRVCGAFFLLAYEICIYQKRKIEHKNVPLLVFIGTVILNVLSFSAPLSVMSVGLALSAALLWSGKESRIEFPVGILFFIYCLGKNFVPSFYYLENGTANGINAIFRLLFRGKINYSSTAYGLPWFFVIMTICTWQTITYDKNFIFGGELIPKVKFYPEVNNDDLCD